MPVAAIYPEWKLRETAGGCVGHWAIYRDEQLKVTCEVFTPCNARTGKIGEGEIRYFLDGDDREFQNEDELQKAYSEGLIWRVIKKPSK